MIVKHQASSTMDNSLPIPSQDLTHSPELPRWIMRSSNLTIRPNNLMYLLELPVIQCIRVLHRHPTDPVYLPSNLILMVRLLRHSKHLLMGQPREPLMGILSLQQQLFILNKAVKLLLVIHKVDSLLQLTHSKVSNLAGTGSTHPNRAMLINLCLTM